MGSTATEVSTSGTIILASSGVRISAPNVVAIGLENVRVNAGNAILQAGSGVTINKPGAFTVGSNITVNHDGVFVFNAQGTTNTAKEHTFLVNADQGMMVGTDNNLLGSSVQLTVSGAVKLGRENACTTAQNGAVYKYPCPNNSKYACLCGCTSAGAVSLSNHKACAGVCDAGASCVIQPQCGDRATAHEAGETTWRPFSNFCADGQDVIGTEPRFPAQGSSVTWQCPSPFDKNIVKTCTATRKKELGGGVKPASEPFLLMRCLQVQMKQQDLLWIPNENL